MIKRELYLKTIRELIDKDIIKIITGIRRSGKSYLLKQVIDELKERGIDEDNILLINFEEPPYNYMNNRKELDEIVLNFAKSHNHKVYLLFDEIQQINEWQKSIAGYKSALTCDIYITGSNSKLLSGELATYLVGRYMKINVYPLSFREFIEFKKEYNNNKKNLNELFKEYVTYGGFPFTTMLNDNLKKSYIRSTYDDIISKDIIQRKNIRDAGILKYFFRYILNNIGNSFSTKSIIKYLKHEQITISNTTIYNYLSYLEEAYIIQKVSNEKIQGKKIMKISEKYYLTDIGFYDALLGESDNIGRKIENIVYLELLKHGYEVTVGKIKNYEIDFICRKNNEIKYIQVCYLLADDKTIEREFRPLMMIQDNYPKYVISLDPLDHSQNGIKHMNIIEFLTKIE